MALYREVRGQTDPNYDQTDLYNAAETIKSIKVICFIIMEFVGLKGVDYLVYYCMSQRRLILNVWVLLVTTRKQIVFTKNSFQSKILTNLKYLLGKLLNSLHLNNIS